MNKYDKMLELNKKKSEDSQNYFSKKQKKMILSVCVRMDEINVKRKEKKGSVSIIKDVFFSLRTTS